jgi:hypothetical protein
VNDASPYAKVTLVGFEQLVHAADVGLDDRVLEAGDARAVDDGLRNGDADLGGAD